MQCLILTEQNGRVSPRTSSQQSDKQSESPVLPHPVTTNGQRGSTNTMSNPERVSPQSSHVDPHNAKSTRVETVASQGFGSGIPAKIEEGIEPGDDNGENMR